MADKFTKLAIERAMKRLRKRIEKELPSIYNNANGIRYRKALLIKGVTLWYSPLGNKTRKAYSRITKEFWKEVLGK